MKLVFDLETDGFYEDAKNIHVEFSGSLPTKAHFKNSPAGPLTKNKTSTNGKK